MIWPKLQKKRLVLSHIYWRALCTLCALYRAYSVYEASLAVVGRHIGCSIICNKQHLLCAAGATPQRPHLHHYAPILYLWPGTAPNLGNPIVLQKACAKTGAIKCPTKIGKRRPSGFALFRFETLPVRTNKKAEYIPNIVVYPNWKTTKNMLVKLKGRVWSGRVDHNKSLRYKGKSGVLAVGIRSDQPLAAVWAWQWKCWPECDIREHPMGKVIWSGTSTPAIPKGVRFPIWM